MHSVRMRWRVQLSCHGQSQVRHVAACRDMAAVMGAPCLGGLPVVGLPLCAGVGTRDTRAARYCAANRYRSMRRHPTSSLSSANALLSLERRRLLQATGAAALATLLPSGAIAGNRSWATAEAVQAAEIGSAPMQTSAAAGFRDALLSSLNLVPVVGGFLSYLGGLFIPLPGESAEQRWRRYTDGQVSDALLALTRADLQGLSAVAGLYRTAVANGNPATVLAQSIATQTVYEASIPRFQTGQWAMEMLPLFAIAATQHLALLRDMALHGTSIGMSEADVASLRLHLRNRIAAYESHVAAMAEQEFARVVRDNPSRGTPHTRNSPLQPLLRRNAELQQSVFDIRDTWYAFDAIRFPGPRAVRLDREIHGLLGWWDSRGSAPDRIPFMPRPSSAVTRLEIFLASYRAKRYTAGAIVTYADRSTQRSGTQVGERIDIVIPAGSSVDSVSLHYSSVVEQIGLRMAGRVIRVGQHDTLTDPVTLAPSGHRLSSVRSAGIGRNTNGQHDSGFLVGFQLVNQQAAPLSVQAFNQLAPRIAPQLLDWIAD